MFEKEEEPSVQEDEGKNKESTRGQLEKGKVEIFRLIIGVRYRRTTIFGVSLS